MGFPRFSMGFPSVFHEFPEVFHGFPKGFPWVSRVCYRGSSPGWDHGNIAGLSWATIAGHGNILVGLVHHKLD